MELTATIQSMLPSVTGQSSKGNWTKQEVIFKTDETYPKDVCISFWNDSAKEINKFKPGQKMKVSINVESREYNGKWYTEVKAWKFESLSTQGETPKSKPTDPFIDKPSDINSENLPF